MEKAFKERDDEASKLDLTLLSEIWKELTTWLADHHQEDPVLPVFRLQKIPEEEKEQHWFDNEGCGKRAVCLCESLTRPLTDLPP